MRAMLTAFLPCQQMRAAPREVHESKVCPHLWSAETTVDGKMTATLVGPIDVLPVQSAMPPGLHPALVLLLDTVLGRHTRLSAPAYPDRWGHGCHSPSISHKGRSDHGCEERCVDGSLRSP